MQLSSYSLKAVRCCLPKNLCGRCLSSSLEHSKVWRCSVLCFLWQNNKKWNIWYGNLRNCWLYKL